MKAVERKQYKAINFDLIIKELEAVFGKGNYRKAYSQIRRFLEKSKFEHRQWSGYRSINTMTYTELLDVCIRLFVHLPWLAGCARRFDVTNIGREYEMLGIMKDQLLNQDDDMSIDIDIMA
ncbi:MAG: hypothetical protein FWG23_06425 [Eggerthellaceae bacterium]|jgi:virulence-associated protein VapD|nr:hypothetical protein [Eggerthellaceae bacterium]MDR2715283.1 hypothetical protein [Coriobacteriaceae bacterium]